MSLRILIAEDDLNLGLLLQEYLQHKRYATKLCRHGEAAWASYNSGQFDLCILDIMMPKMDGFTLAQKIRNKNTQTPIIFLTARQMTEDKIKGLKIGADDYVTKPFSMEELLLRIDAVCRRCKPQHLQTKGTFKLGQLTLDLSLPALATTNKTIHLTTKEAALLGLLLERKDMLLSRSEALTHVWGDDNYFNARSMDVYIAKLRKLLRADPKVRIVTIHGRGFKLVFPD